jgi:hypothetical protein
VPIALANATTPGEIAAPPVSVFACPIVVSPFVFAFGG